MQTVNEFEAGYKAGFTKGYKNGVYNTFCYEVDALSTDLKQKLYDFLLQLAAEQKKEREEKEDI